MLEVTPEAGHVKNKQFRLVPIHPRLVELGFLDYVASAGAGPLFFDPSSRRKASAKEPLASTVSADLAEWVRANGLGDPRLARPLHSLRHRFMTIARWSKVEQQYVSAIVGHAPGDQNQEYGHFPPEVLRREMLRLPAEKIEGRADGSPAGAVS